MQKKRFGIVLESVANGVLVLSLELLSIYGFLMLVWSFPGFLTLYGSESVRQGYRASPPLLWVVNLGPTIIWITFLVALIAVEYLILKRAWLIANTEVKHG